MRRRPLSILSSIFCASLFVPAPVFPLGMETFGNKPVTAETEWAAGVVEAVNQKSRVYSSWRNGNESFYFRGSTNQLNEMLQRFAAIDIEVREVVILARRGGTQSFQGNPIACDWELKVPSGIFLAMARRATTPVHPVLPTVVIFAGSPGVRLEKLEIPDGVRLLGVEDVVWRSMAILKTSDRRSERRIREFIFAWQYGWLKGAVGIAVVAAATLLVATVVVGRARRARNAEVP